MQNKMTFAWNVDLASFVKKKKKIAWYGIFSVFLFRDLFVTCFARSAAAYTESERRARQYLHRSHIIHKHRYTHPLTMRSSARQFSNRRNARVAQLQISVQCFINYLFPNRRHNGLLLITVCIGFFFFSFFCLNRLHHCDMQKNASWKHEDTNVSRSIHAAAKKS